MPDGKMKLPMSSQTVYRTEKFMTLVASRSYWDYSVHFPEKFSKAENNAITYFMLF